MKAVILARVSTREQEETGYSLSAQLNSLRNYAQKKGFDIDKEFCFSESAGPKIRKKFEEVLAYIRKNNIKVLLCENVDRATRNFKDAVSLDEMRINEGLEIHFVKDGFFINQDATGNQMFMWESKVFLAKQYLNRLSDDVKRTVWEKFYNHEWAGKAPKGYKNARNPEGKPTIVPDDHDAPLIVRMFEQYATGNSSHKILREEMYKLGLKSNVGTPLSLSMVAHILQDPFYYGLMRLKGKENAHKYKPLVTKELYDKCQEIRMSWNKKPFQFAAKPFIFRGLIKCAQCGCTISPEVKKGKFVYYSCTNYRKTCHRAYVPEKELLEPVYDVLWGIQLPDERIKEITEALRSTGKSEAEFHKYHLKNLKEEYDTIESRIPKMYDDKLDGRITNEIYDKKLKEWKERQAVILSDMKIHSDADQEFYLTANTILNLAQRAQYIFESSEVPEKRQLLNYLLQNCQLDGRKLVFSLRSPFDKVLATANAPTGLRW